MAAITLVSLAFLPETHRRELHGQDHQGATAVDDTPEEVRA
jgi:hypothetical protein